MVAGDQSFDAPARERASALLDEVDREPATVEPEAVALALGTTDADPATASIAWRAAGIARRMLGRVTDALTALDAAVEAATRAADPQLAGLARTSRAAPRFMSGDMDGGLADIVAALALLDGADRGIALFQRAQYLDVVEDPDAAAAFGAAIDALTGSPDHEKYLGHALANRGLHHLNAGRLDAATGDLDRALAIWERLGSGVLAATVVHNLGVAAMTRGDFVAALDHFEQAHQRTATLGHDNAASGWDYCNALLAVGLAGEALERAAELAATTDGHGDAMVAAELRLLAAHAALQQGDVAATAAMAGDALAAFDTAGRPGWSAQARLALTRAAVEGGALDSAAVDRLAAELRQHGWHDAALNAELLAADALARQGRAADAELRLAGLAPALRTARAERRLQSATVAATAAAAHGDGAAARRHVRRGLTIVEQEQRSVGAIDARAHFASHAAALLTIGREQAIGRRDARAAWADLERMRALSLRHPRVLPVDGGELDGLLAQLRSVSTELSMAEPGEPAWHALSREQRRLQRRVADHVRRTPGAAEPVAGVDLAAVTERLGDGAMVTLDAIGGRLWALPHDGATGRLRRFDAGDLSAFTDRAAAVQASVRRLARRTLNPRSAELAVAQITELAAWFDAHLPLGDDPGQPLVLVVPAELAAVPWAALPRLTGRTVSLAPSAWTWWRSSTMPASTSPATGAAFVAGPGLPAAAAEVGRAAAAHTAATVLAGPAATAAAALDEVGRASLAHVAAHYAPRRGNPLFSAFELADGPWFLHDLARRPQLPATWVVPSCESSVGDAPVAGELLGLTSVLLGAGARSIVLSSGLVPDDPVTVDAMTALHRALADGLGPAAALARVLAGLDGSPAAVVLRATLACHGAW